MSKIRLLAGDMRHIAGSATYCEQLALRLESCGHEVSVVCLGANKRLKDRCQVLELERSPWRQSRVAWRFAFQLDEHHATKLFRRAPLSEVELVIGLEHMLLRAHHKRFPKTRWLYVPLSLVAPLEIRSYALGTVATWLGAGKFHRLQSWALKHADATIRFSQMSCRLLESHYGTNCAKRLLVCDMPIEIPQEPPSKKTPDVMRMLVVGRVTESKNFEFPIHALASMRQYPWQLDIVGDGPYLSAIRKLIAALDLESRITCHGRVPNTDNLYRSADLFLFTSKLDNCPLVVLESMSYGVPVLGIRPDGHTYVSGIEEMILDNADGILAEGEQGFIRSLEKILRDPSRLQKLGSTARARIESRNTWNAHVSFFNELVTQRIGEGLVANRISGLASPTNRVL